MDFSLLAGKVIDFTANIVIAVALHVPFLLNALMIPPQHPIVSPTAISTKSTPTQVSKPMEPVAERPKKSCSGTCIPIDPKAFFEGEHSLGDGTSYYDKESSTTVTIKYSEMPSRNPGFNVYINNVLAGRMEGQGLSQTSFSPNHKYLAVRTRSILGCAGMCENHSLYVIRLNSPLIAQLRVKPSGENAEGLFGKDTFIESYTWNTDSLSLITYIVGLSEDNQTFRVSPKQIWIYNLEPFNPVYGIISGTSTSKL